MNETLLQFARSVLTPVAVFFGGLLGLLVVLYLIVQVACGHPSDARLARRFYAHEAEFNELVRMTEVDSQMYRIAPNFAFPENRFTERRWDDYRARFNRLSISKGLVKPIGGDSILFMASVDGLLFGRGSSKGYVYSLSPLSPCVSDLSDDPPIWAIDANYHYIVYKPLKGNWYLYYEFR